ncbi:unnamed protein product [Owenia fusiformis]|uniref:Uncharacterized protein n=1 Tax=Owenia fusiformis TaxID=6347 RepID=A0A8J1UEQ1_OWEFU|nr:unnamed protein product [Owenia fusiformis]
MLSYLLFGAVVFLVYVFIKTIRNEKSKIIAKIPGPKGIPLFGNALQVDLEHIHKDLLRWTKEYGPIFKLNFAGDLVVVLNSYDAIYEALVTKSADFAGRPNDTFRVKAFSKNEDVIFEDYTDKIKYMKKLMLQGLKMYGEERSNIIKITQSEVNLCMDKFAAKNNEPFYYDDAVETMILKILAEVIGGVQFADDHPYIKQIAEFQNKAGRVMSAGNGVELDMFPWLRFFGNQNFKLLTESCSLRDAAMSGMRIECEKSLDSNNSVMAGFIRAQRDPLTPHQISDYNIIMTSANLIGAGLTTTKATISGLFLLLMRHPDIQAKLQEEVDQVVGKDRNPSVDDKESMPYLQATLIEVLRYLTHVPISVPHKTLVDTSVAGYDVPKGTQVWTNIFAMHHNPAMFPDPWQFKPERWLDNDDKLVSLEERNKAISFGAGRRVCVGEQFARTRLFLFCATLLQKFTISPPDGSQSPSPDPRDFPLGIVLHPVPFQIKAIARQ